MNLVRTYFSSNSQMTSSYECHKIPNDVHILEGEHISITSVTVWDEVKNMYIDLTRSIDDGISGQRGDVLYDVTHNEDISALKKGWAVPKRTRQSFSTKQKKIVFDKFNLGETTKRKYTADQIVDQLRLSNEYTPAEYLMIRQVRALISQFSSKKRKSPEILVENEITGKELIDAFETKNEINKINQINSVIEELSRIENNINF